MHLIHPKPQAGEALTSWLIRTAQARGLRLHVLTQQLAGDLEFWTRDGDLLAPPALLEAVAASNGVPLGRAEATTLRSFEGVLDEAISGTHQSRMIRPLGVFHRTRRAFGQQACSLCLAEQQPYFRLIWRLRLITCCTRHGVLLIDACHGCGEPIIPHRGGLTICHACGYDLCQAPPVQADSRVLRLQYESEQVLRGRPVMWPHLQGAMPIIFFRLQLALVQAILARSWGRRLRGELRRHLDDFMHEAEVSSDHPASPPTDHQAMRGVEFLLRGWPAMLAGVAGEARAWASWILPEEGDTRAPFTLRSALDSYLRPGSARISL